ncbi:MAG: hypothetical protein U0324_45535 [Polyangiales bacterium]
MGTHVVQAMTGRLPLVVTRIRRPGQHIADLVELADAWVFFTTARLPGGVDLLLGQHDALERLTFAQMNHPPAPGFVLHRPIARRSQ